MLWLGRQNPKGIEGCEEQLDEERRQKVGDQGRREQCYQWRLRHGQMYFSYPARGMGLGRVAKIHPNVVAMQTEVGQSWNPLLL